VGARPTTQHQTSPTPGSRATYYATATRLALRALLFFQRKPRDVTSRRFILIVLAIGLLAALYIGGRRERHEAAARNVEIVMDDSDFSALAKSYAYNEAAFLTALRRAGLTSLAVSEELGANIPAAPGAAAYTGGALLDQSRVSPLSDPLFARLARTNALRGDTMYLVAYDAPTARRYAQQLPLHFAPRTIRVLRAALPAVWAIRTTGDYFDGEGFGLPLDRVELAKRLGLLLVPRLQNDEGFTPAQLQTLVDDATHGVRARTAIFFGLRNEVLGYPDNIEAAAAALTNDHVNFGTIETYDPKQEQLGNADLARKMPERLVRVQAIAKPEADKLTPEEIIARYLLGVNERNIRVVYLRPYQHSWNGRSIEQTNVEIVRRIAAGIRADHKRIASASAFSKFTIAPVEILLASLAVPAILLLLFAPFGLTGRAWIIAFILADVLLVGAGYAVHHDILVRKLLALIAGLAFPSVGMLAVAWAFRGDPDPIVRSTNVYVRGLIALAIGIVVTLGGAIVIVGLLSTPLTMTEIDRFLGVKYVLALPPLIALGLYFFTDRFGAKIDPRAAGDTPVKVAQLLAGLVLIAVAYLVLERSGNQSDIAPSSFELALRAHLTTILQVRPRFKEFVLAWPALMLVPALVADDRKRWGWLFVLAVGVGFGDLIDTFSHLHTPLLVGAERVVNGGVLGAVIGCLAVFVYRKLRIR
jgi:Family of unknown function (DUF5693)